MADVEEISGSPLGPGTLYGALARLERRGLIEALERGIGDGRTASPGSALDAPDPARRLGGSPGPASSVSEAMRDEPLLNLYPRAGRSATGRVLDLLAEHPPDWRDRSTRPWRLDARLNPRSRGHRSRPRGAPVVRGPCRVARRLVDAPWRSVLWIATFVVVVNSRMIVDQWGGPLPRYGIRRGALFFGAVMLLLGFGG